MNFSQLILEFLHVHGQVHLPGFGTFYLQNINALLDEAGKFILPPGKEVAFKTSVTGTGQDFAHFVAEQNNITLSEAEETIKNQLFNWNESLLAEQKISVEHLGTFYLEDNRTLFKGNRTENRSPDFYGLEEIKLSEIKAGRAGSESYKMNTSWMWITGFLLIAGIGGYFALMQPDIIFGQKSFSDKPLLKVNPSAVKTDTIKTDSLKSSVLKADSLRADSIKSAAAASKTPAAKRSSKNYTKSQWQKQRKHQNRSR